jgi:thioredoxin-related protein
MRAVPSLLPAFLVVSLLANAGSALARPRDAGPPPAAAVLERAKTAAARNDRRILLVFHASWCGWCRKFEAFLSSPGVKEIVDRNYEVVALTALERPGKQDLENPGAAAVFHELGGEGLPFFAILDAKGKKLETSIGPGGNIGYPKEPQEIEAFAAVLRRTAPRISEAELALVKRRLREP